MAVAMGQWLCRWEVLQAAGTDKSQVSAVPALKWEVSGHHLGNKAMPMASQLTN